MHRNARSRRQRKVAAAGAATVLAVVAVIIGTVNFSRAQPPDASALFVLGDSLSDIGNAAAISDFLLDEPFYPEYTVGLCNPGEILLLRQDCTDLLYRRSRVSNGPVAVEHLAEALAVPALEPSFHIIPDRPTNGTNYAVAGAKARDSGVNGLPQQVDALQIDHGPRLPADALYVVMIGGNDAIDALQAAALPALTDTGEALSEAESPDEETGSGGDGSAQEIVTAALDAIAENVERLLGAGARRVVVANIPELGHLPAVRSTAERRNVPLETALDAARSITASFNQGLEERLVRLDDTHPGAEIIRFDLAAALAARRSEAEAAGRNVTDACFDSERYSDSLQALRVFHDDCAPDGDEAPRFDRFLFWDGIHPTGDLHAALGSAMAATVSGSEGSEVGLLGKVIGRR